MGSTAMPYFGNNQPGSNQNGSTSTSWMPGNSSASNPFGTNNTSTQQSSYYNGYNPYQIQATGPTPYGGGTADPGLQYGATQGATTNPGSENLGHGIIATGLQYGGLSQDFANYLQSQVGAGLTPYSMSTVLPTGGSTAPGQLTAGMNPLMSQLMNFYQTGQGGSMPGMSQLSNIANNGVSALPEWQSMVAAQQQNIQQNQANLAEQYGSMGDLAGSGFGNAMSNYMSQTTANQNALLSQLQQSNIQNIQMPAINELFSGSQSFSNTLQNLNQSAIENQYNAYEQDLPQNNPMLQYIAQYGSMYPPTTKTPTTSQMAMDWANTAGSVYNDVFG